MFLSYVLSNENDLSYFISKVYTEVKESSVPLVLRGEKPVIIFLVHVETQDWYVLSCFHYITVRLRPLFLTDSCHYS